MAVIRGQRRRGRRRCASSQAGKMLRRKGRLSAKISRAANQIFERDRKGTGHKQGRAGAATPRTPGPVSGGGDGEEGR